MITSPRRLTATLSVLGVSAALVLTAVPAQAASTSIAAPSGIAGVAESVFVNAPASKNKTVPVTFTLTGAPVATLNVALGAKGTGTVTWTPTAAGTWSIAAAGGSTSAAVAAMPTETVLMVQNNIAINTPTSIVVGVWPSSGTTVPTGTVTVTNVVTGQVIGSASLAPSPSSPRAYTASATITWTPTGVANYALIATYTPAIGNGLASSVSPQYTAFVDYNAPLVVMRLPYPVTMGTPTIVTGIVNQSMVTGSMAFTTSYSTAGAWTSTTAGLTGSQNLVNNAVSFVWTPTVPGNQILQASFSGKDNNGFAISGISNQAVYVEPQPAGDTIALSASGIGALNASTRPALRFGSPVALSATAVSGAPVALSASGACAISGNVLFAIASKGACTVTATSPGSRSYDPATATTVLTAAPKAKKR